MMKTAPVFERKLYQKMLQWKKERDGSTALMIKGARRVGKSTIVEQFAKQEYKSYILIDFSKASSEIMALFDDLSNLDYIFLRLKIAYQVELEERKSCIVFDEIQLCPKARQAIKHLVKDHRYDYIETGSLISIKKNVEKIVIPSEETRMELFPLDYEEFRWALGDRATANLLREAVAKRIPLGNGVHRKLMRDFRLYMLVGGMPQAVHEYIRSNSFKMVDSVKREIIELYEDDFSKIDPSGRAASLFDAIPAQLTGNAKRYQVSSVLPGTKADRVEEIVANMSDSSTIALAYHANDPNTGLAMNKNINFYKMFTADTGLFVTLAFKDKDFTDNIIYEKLLSDKTSANLGYIYENAVAQMLRAAGHELYYYAWPKENTNSNYEVDFIISEKSKICPIEVKSSGYKSHASLDEFCKKYSRRIGRRFLAYTKDFMVDGKTDCIPVYWIPFLQS